MVENYRLQVDRLRLASHLQHFFRFVQLENLFQSGPERTNAIIDNFHHESPDNYSNVGTRARFFFIGEVVNSAAFYSHGFKSKLRNK